MTVGAPARASATATFASAPPTATSKAGVCSNISPTGADNRSKTSPKQTIAPGSATCVLSGDLGRRQPRREHMHNEQRHQIGTRCGDKNRCIGAHTIKYPACVPGDNHAADGARGTADAYDRAHGFARKNIGWQRVQIGRKSLMSCRCKAEDKYSQPEILDDVGKDYRKHGQRTYQHGDFSRSIGAGTSSHHP